MLQIDDVNRWTKWEVAIHFENRVVVEPRFEKHEADRVASKDWVIETHSAEASNGRKEYWTRVYESTDSGTRKNSDELVVVDTPRFDRKQQQKRAFAILTAQVVEAEYTYSINPHTGEVLEEPEHL